MAIRWYLLFISTKVAPVFANTFRMPIIIFFFSASSVAILSTALFSTNTEWKKIYRNDCNAFVKLCEMWTVNTMMWRFRKSDTECLYVFLFNTISTLLCALSLSRRYEQSLNNRRIERCDVLMYLCNVMSSLLLARFAWIISTAHSSSVCLFSFISEFSTLLLWHFLFSMLLDAITLPKWERIESVSTENFWSISNSTVRTGCYDNMQYDKTKLKAIKFRVYVTNINTLENETILLMQFSYH